MHFRTEPSPVRIDRFIEKRFDARIVHESMRTGVLGYTVFGSNGVESVHVAEPSQGEQSRAAERRINSTLAHEAGHGLLHAHLFALEEDHLELFGHDPDVTQSKVLCRDEPSRPAVPKQRQYDGRWWELQANRAIGALLMPQPLFLQFMEELLDQDNVLGMPTLAMAQREIAARAVAEEFDVNPAAARVRIDKFYPDQGSQLTF